MGPVRFISWNELLDAHQDQLQKHGGQDGFVDEGVVRSVLNRAQFTAQYNEDADVADLAADYMFGFATTQGFMDGNKRTAVSAANIFVEMNGFEFIMSDRVLYLVAMAIARGEIDRNELSDILRDHLQELQEDGD